jgi:hypothetical protein
MRTRTRKEPLQFDPPVAQKFLAGVHASAPVSGLTHTFYRYPARFSPQFARAAIETFSAPGDVVLDPFMGGATTLVEAHAAGRTGIGVDINELSCFIARAKTTSLTDNDIKTIRLWTGRLVPGLNLRLAAKRPHEWIAAGYQRNVNSRQTWPIRKSLELALEHISQLHSTQQRTFARAVLLRTGQWALDCRSDVPSANVFRGKIIEFLEEMITGVKAYRDVTAPADDQAFTKTDLARTIILNRSAEGLEDEPVLASQRRPKLVLTSPPYPGVHVLYHRWQILGRKETAVPFWLADARDGNGSSYYTFGDRKRPDLESYFDTAHRVFESIGRIADESTLIVQMVAFSHTSWQLPRYLHTMRLAGLRELRIPGLANSDDGRLWRRVPNRKWYAERGSTGDAGKEVVLFHACEA